MDVDETENIREVLFLEIARGRLQSDSSGGLGVSFGGPISGRPRTLPNRLPGSEGGAGLNLLPIVQVSSVSAGPTGAPSCRRPDPRRLNEGPWSASGGGALEGDDLGGARLERQSEAESATVAGGGSRDGGPSKRLREASRDDARSGRGPSRLQLDANLSSSPPPIPPKPDLSLAANG